VFHFCAIKVSPVVAALVVSVLVVAALVVAILVEAVLAVAVLVVAVLAVAVLTWLCSHGCPVSSLLASKTKISETN
jgi:uncharacterized protein YggT (Ycf19 family)